MAQLTVTTAVLGEMLQSLDAVLGRLRATSEDFARLFPDGMTIRRAPPVQNAIPSLIELAAQIDAQVAVKKTESIFGVSDKSKRVKRRYGGKQE